MAWYITFYQVLVQLATTSLLLLIVASAAILAIRQPARRIRVIEWTLVGLLLLPGLALVPGYPRWSILLTHDAPASPAVVVAARMQPTEQAEAWPSMPIETNAEPLEEPTDEVLIASVEPRITVQAEVDLAGFPQATTPSTMVPIAPQPKWGFTLPRDFRFWIVIVYLSGVAGMALWSLVGLVALKRLLRTARPADVASRDLLREIAGPRNERVVLMVSGRTGQPCAFAWRPATIVLPQELCHADGSQRLRWALAHEWSHVDRGDVWSWSLSGIVRWFYFYQPLLWWLRRQLQLSQDFVADSQAARSGKLPEDYAEFLTSRSASYSRPTLAAGLGIGGRGSDLKRRVVMLVENRRPLEIASPRKWNLAAFPLAILIVAAVACLGEQPAGAGGEPEQQAVSEPKIEAAKPATATDPESVQPFGPQIGGSKPVVAKAPSGEKPATRQAVPAKVRPPAQPRKIVPGDVLVVEVIPNIETSQAGLAHVLLRPEMKLIVDENGKISLGSRYGSVSVQELNLSEAQEQIQKHLMISQLPDARNTINVRVMFAEPAANKPVKAQTPAGQVQSAPPRSARLQYLEKMLNRGYITQQEYTEQFAAANADEPEHIKPGDILSLEVEGAPNDHPVKPIVTVDADGRVALGARYGKVNIQGKTLDEAEAVIRSFLLKTLKDPEVQLAYWRWHTPSPGFISYNNSADLDVSAGPNGPTVSPYMNLLQEENQAPKRIKPGDILNIEIAGGLLDVPPRMVAVVESSGKVALGVHYGRVEVRGKTLEEAEEAIKKSLSVTIKDPQVQVTYWRANEAERLKGDDTLKVKQLEREVNELKSLIQDLKAGKSPSR